MSAAGSVCPGKSDVHQNVLESLRVVVTGFMTDESEHIKLKAYVVRLL